MLACTQAPQIRSNSVVPGCVAIYGPFQYRVIALLPAALQCEHCANTRHAAAKQLCSCNCSYGTRARCSSSALLECHSVHVCAFANEQLHHTQVAVPSCFVQGSEAFSAKEMGDEGR